MLNDDQRIKSFKTLSQLEEEIIRHRLEDFRWNKQSTAKSLGVAYKTIFNRMRTYGIPIEPPPEFVKKKHEEHRKGKTVLSTPIPVRLRSAPTMTFHWVVDGKRHHEFVNPDELYIPTFNRTKHVPVTWRKLEGYVYAKELAETMFP